MARVVEADPKPDGTGPGPFPRRWGVRGRLSMGHLVMIVSGVLAFLLTFSVLRTRDEMVPVSVAARDIPAGTPVEASALRTAEIRAGDQVLATLVRPGELGRFEGWVAASTIRSGDLVSRSALRPPAAGDGLAAMSIPIEREHAVGGDLAPGDRVDVIEVRDGEARYLVRGAEVLAVGTRGPAGFAAEGITSFSITISVDPDEALEIAAAIREAGLEIVRSTGATFIPEGTPQGA